jgi:hypothetical protein
MFGAPCPESHLGNASLAKKAFNDILPPEFASPIWRANFAVTSAENAASKNPQSINGPELALTEHVCSKKRGGDVSYRDGRAQDGPNDAGA